MATHSQEPPEHPQDERQPEVTATPIDETPAELDFDAAAGESKPCRLGQTPGFGDALSNPLEAQPLAIEALGPAETRKCGIYLVSAWIVVSWFTSWRLGSALASLTSFNIGGVQSQTQSIGIGNHVEWIVNAAVPLAALLLVFYLLRNGGGNPTSFTSILFTTGVVLMPIVAMWLFFHLIALFTPKSPYSGGKLLFHTGLIVVVTTATSVTLLIKASLVTVLGHSRKAALWLTPLVLIATGHLSKWLFGIVN